MFGIMKDKKRPILVLVILIFFLVTVVSTLLSLYLIYVGKISLVDMPGIRFKSLTFIDIGLSLFVGLTNLTGALLLFFLRKQALYFFVVSLIVNLSVFSWQIISRGMKLLGAISLDGLIGMAIAWAILIAICLYTWRLKKTGVLE